MRKPLILCVLALMPAIWNPIWGQAKAVRENKTGIVHPNRATGRNQRGNADQRGTKELPLVVDTEGHQKTESERTKADAERQHILDVENRTLQYAWLTAWSTASLVIVGIGGTCTAIYTLREIRKQTEAAKISAEVALRNTQAIINAERPWVVISVESTNANEFVFKAKNVGRTPANITAIWSGHIWLSRNEVLQLPDGYFSKDGLFGFDHGLLPPTVSRAVGRCKLEDLRRNDSVNALPRVLNEGFASVYHCGKVIYRDALDPHAEHKTKWVYLYLPSANNFIPDPSHPEWNSHTEGERGQQQPN